MNAELSWDAITYTKDGVDRLCAPACGHHCTLEEFHRCRAYAKRLAETLGGGWEPDLSENLGWHWGVEHPASGVTVRRNTRRSYWAKIMVGERTYQFTASSAKRAVDMLVRQMADHADELKGRILTLYPKP